MWPPIRSCGLSKAKRSRGVRRLPGDTPSLRYDQHMIGGDTTQRLFFAVRPENSDALQACGRPEAEVDARIAGGEIGGGRRYLTDPDLFVCTGRNLRPIGEAIRAGTAQIERDPVVRRLRNIVEEAHVSFEVHHQKV